VTDDMKNVRRKRLQLNFKSDGETIKFVAPPQWLYRVDKAATETKDKESEPQPKQPKAETTPTTQDEYIAAFEAKIAEGKEELKEREAEIKRAWAELEGLRFQLKNRPAGDTPELQGRDFQRARELEVGLAQMAHKHHFDEKILAECEKTLNELPSKRSQR